MGKLNLADELDVYFTAAIETTARFVYLMQISSKNVAQTAELGAKISKCISFNT